MEERKEEFKHLDETCGSHCGYKDKIAGHCNCPECHKGSLPKATVQISTSGKVLPKEGVVDA